ncbi:DUF2017 family protein [Microbacterium invictum]|uniref:DUF2017 domain-containing protein n=1 Tax=Microbacterium invictum TaxID=515415 RepID=A0AA40VLM9_9MICO|nr:MULTISPECIES: DUF2017 family protein [Microbacterium]MBB4138992.1 hypothetical protein [Microbacterium invictum]
MSGPVAVIVLSRLEAAHLTALTTQFTDLVADTVDATADPAVARLVPDAYRDDADAAQEFRSLTEADLLHRRADDAALVLASLLADGETLDPAQMDAGDAQQEFAVALDADHSGAWLRTLSALRLVLASRLGIETEDDHDADDQRYAIYDWLGYRLDGLVQALDA